MLTQADQRESIKECLVTFLRSLDKEFDQINDDTDLIAGLGLKSDEGLELSLDLEDALDCSLPDGFNPAVHPTGTRGMRFGELTIALLEFVSAGEVH